MRAPRRSIRRAEHSWTPPDPASSPQAVMQVAYATGDLVSLNHTVHNPEDSAVCLVTYGSFLFAQCSFNKEEQLRLE